jgi:hypothetical protein
MSGDWEDVREFYAWMFKEEAPMSIGGGSVNTEEVERLQDILDTIVGLASGGVRDASYQPPDPQIQVPDIDDTELIVESTKEGKMTTIVAPSNSPDLDEVSFITVDVKDDGFTIDPNHVAENRDPHEAQLVDCEICGKEFDYAAEYPRGHRIGDGSRAKCDKCKMQPSGDSRNPGVTTGGKRGRRGQ